MTTCDASRPVSWDQAREHLCDLEPGHAGAHECGWCIACDVEGTDERWVAAPTEFASQPDLMCRAFSDSAGVLLACYRVDTHEGPHYDRDSNAYFPVEGSPS